MARPKGSTNIEAVVEAKKATQIKHVSRVISTRNTGTSESVDQVEAQLAAYFADGWDLFDVVVLAHDPNSITVFYTLVK
jgi:hypothetical protein